MAEKFDEMAVITRQEKIGTGIYSMWIRTEQVAEHAKAGQFVSVYCNDGSRILPRPISICEINKEEKTLRLVYRVAGKGTGEFSAMKTGETLHIVGPLGNGFPKKEKKAFLIGGGIGIPPMLQLAKELDCEKQIVLGYRDELFSMEERMACGIGACLACVCKSKEKDAHSNVNNKRICKEGPVFLAEEVEF